MSTWGHVNLSPAHGCSLFTSECVRFHCMSSKPPIVCSAVSVLVTPTATVLHYGYRSYHQYTSNLGLSCFSHLSLTCSFSPLLEHMGHTCNSCVNVPVSISASVSTDWLFSSLGVYFPASLQATLGGWDRRTDCGPGHQSTKDTAARRSCDCHRQEKGVH